MYLLDYNHPTELFDDRREALMREAREARLARELRAARSKGDAGTKSVLWGEIVGRTLALLGWSGGSRVERNRGPAHER